jgi:hypothetical protein
MQNDCCLPRPAIGLMGKLHTIWSYYTCRLPIQEAGLSLQGFDQIDAAGHRSLVCTTNNVHSASPLCVGQRTTEIYCKVSTAIRRLEVLVSSV